jgi:hypothetical protein
MLTGKWLTEKCGQIHSLPYFPVSNIPVSQPIMSRRCSNQVILLLLSLVALPPGVPLAQDKPRVRPDTKTNRVLEALEQEYAANRFSDAWAYKLKELIELGQDAVPDMIAELDATDSDPMLRNLGFAARAIGDKRLVPALIRALPRTLRKPGSDMGLHSNDKDLFAFMQKHDLDEKDNDRHYGFGRPVREIGGALQKLTGAKHDEEQIYGVFLQGGPHQQQMQKLLYRRCADRWAAWWEGNWQQHVSDKKYALVGLPNSDLVTGQQFPQGPTVKMGGHSSGHTAEADGDPTARYEVFYDLDTGRRMAFPEELASLQDDPHRLDKIQAWAAREGFDLMGTYYQTAGDKQPRHAIRGLGLTAWEINVKRYQAIDTEITKNEPLPMGQPAGGLLLHYDEKRGEYDAVTPAAFLFVTREGTYGALLVGVEVLDTNVKLGVPVEGEQALNPVGFHKGRRFSVKIVEPAEEAKP